MKPAIQARKPAASVLPPPLVRMPAIARMLLRNTDDRTPEARLVVAVICQAMIDARVGTMDDSRTARAFLTSKQLDPWADLVGLNPAFVREVAVKTHYLPEPPAKKASTHKRPRRMHS